MPDSVRVCPSKPAGDIADRDKWKTSTARRLPGWNVAVTRGRILVVVFLLALILGPGPGATLLDGSADAPRFIAGIPALYLWLVFWFVVMATCVVTAARTVWKDSD